MLLEELMRTKMGSKEEIQKLLSKLQEDPRVASVEDLEDEPNKRWLVLSTVAMICVAENQYPEFVYEDTFKTENLSESVILSASASGWAITTFNGGHQTYHFATKGQALQFANELDDRRGTVKRKIKTTPKKEDFDHLF